jgi:DNA-binding transcriptional ArsR family regulator
MRLMDKFYALSAPIRREIIAMLSDGEQLSATAIAEKFQVSPPAISQHLKVLLNSKLLQVSKQAQQRIYELNPAAIKELEAWANQIVTQLNQASKLIEAQGVDGNLEEVKS